MRKHLLGLMLVAGLAGCTSESGPDSIDTAVARAPASLAANAPTSDSLAALRGAPTSFASLPDRGELMAYGGARKSRQSGAYTYHPVAISEAHALNAIGSGELVVATPDGEPVRIKYERHEEQPDGNWTWIGRNADGTSAVLTFGEKAVFGMISRGDDYYRVRTDRTGAWVVETDRSLVAANGGRREDGPDFLVPPDSGALAAAASRRTAQAATSESGSVKPLGGEKAVAVVDLLVGYSNGLASVYGSQSAAATFVTSLAAITNAAYADSGVSMRLRVVHTLQVNYADTSDNQTALEQMTGYDSSAQQPITPNSAFNALRAARNQYGADLVAFVRQYREPEQDGCGIAWLLGMNQSGITAANDAEFGYAVVSDGEDRDEGDGNTYFCSDYSLAHELGHLMGQAHNSEDAQGRAGAHAYSYGYREASATGFFTIMAYPSGDGQLELPLFANPALRHSGRPVGTANADNVRSMNQTMPIIGTFRATVVPIPQAAPNDFNGDGRSDIFWHNTATLSNGIWFSANSATTQVLSKANSAAWKVAGVGDFNGDGRADILWRNTATGANAIWRSGNVATSQSLTGLPDQAWQVAGVGDFNGDGASDILWHNSTTRANSVWFSGNRATAQAFATASGAGWRIAGVGDFNGDGISDILWRNTSTGSNGIWRSGSAATPQAVSAVTDQNWQVAGVGDFNGDGRSDILWHNNVSRANGLWFSGNLATSQTLASANSPAWRIVAVGDYDGDRWADILWRNVSTGANGIWRRASVNSALPVSPVADQAWKVIP